MMAGVENGAWASAYFTAAALVIQLAEAWHRSKVYMYDSFRSRGYAMWRCPLCGAADTVK